MQNDWNGWDVALQEFGLREAETVQVSAAAGSGETTRGAFSPQNSIVPPGTSVVLVAFENSDAVLMLPPETERGVAGLLVRLVTSSGLGRAIIKPFVNAVADRAIDMWESKARPDRVRLYRQVDAASTANIRPIGADDWTMLGSGRSLLLLHDQFSQTQRSFAGLDSALLGELSNRYRGCVWAYDHPTVGATPQENAARLHSYLEQARQGGTWDIDILAVGRGGLVAREFAKSAAANVSIGNVMTVGSPLLGTPLAQPKTMVQFVNRIANLLALGPDPISDVASVFASIVATTVEQIGEHVPGITAMAPPANVSGAKLRADAFGASWRGRLVCIGSNYSPAGDGKLTSTFSNWVFDGLLDNHPNDLFVPTASAQPAAPAGLSAQRPDVGNLSHPHYIRSTNVWAEIRKAFLDAPLKTREVAPVAEPTLVRVGDPEPAMPTGRTSPLSITVRHGSIEHLTVPVIVGHLQGTPLSGPEERLDRLCDGELSERRLLGRYAGEVGEVVLVHDIASIPATAIVGLGATGELTATQLTRALIPAFIDLARDHIDRSHGDPAITGVPPLSVALVPIGTSYASGVTVEASVRATLAAVQEAELGLADARKGRSEAADTAAGLPREVFFFDGVEFIERYQDKVEILVAVLDRLAEEAHGEGIEMSIQSTPKAGEGAAPGWPPNDRDEVWRRLCVRIPTEDALRGTIEYTVTGRLAKAETITKAFDKSVVDPMLRQAIAAADDESFPRALYELLVPAELKGELATGENLHLLVDESSAYLPWELLTPRAVGYQASVPLALRGGVLRQFKENNRSWSQPARAGDVRALVIGNPPCDRAKYPALPGAAEEATQVARVLTESRWTVKDYIWDGSDNVLASAGGAAPANLNTVLVTGEWRVVHIAAHGIVGDDTQPGGIVLGDEQFITPSVFGSLGIVPDLVFVNACHLGTIGHSLAKPRSALAGVNNVSASVARALMQIGVRAVVVAGWAINDRAASAFATSLYESMLKHSQPFGVAVQKARKAAREAAPYSQTWGAYQCYGDAGFRLFGRRSGKAFPRPYPKTEAEFHRRVGWVIADAGENGRNGKKTANELVLELDDLCPSPYRQQPGDVASATPSGQVELAADVLALLGEAYATLKQWEPAIALYGWALRQEKSTASVRTIEQLGNVLSRSASGRADARERFELAEDWLNRALHLGQTGERHALLGSHLKKRATAAAANSPERNDYFQKSYEHYMLAAKLKPNGYHCCAWAQLAALSRMNGEEVDLVGVRALFQNWKRDTYKPDTSSFWGRSAAGDLALTEWLLNEALAERPTNGPSIEMAVASYVDAFNLRSSETERDTVKAHLVDLGALSGVDAVRLALTDAASGLAGWKLSV